MGLAVSGSMRLPAVRFGPGVEAMRLLRRELREVVVSRAHHFFQSDWRLLSTGTLIPHENEQSVKGRARRVLLRDGAGLA